ncbi:hypothetical protein K438DRAFT_1777854 [Mycena galopus ATCC 62051]|nr:hypothetical protein K438DRAFT_1777854 [Mycena galopus ATCC 62051]
MARRTCLLPPSSAMHTNATLAPSLLITATGLEMIVVDTRPCVPWVAELGDREEPIQAYYPVCRYSDDHYSGAPFDQNLRQDEHCEDETTLGKLSTTTPRMTAPWETHGGNTSADVPNYRLKVQTTLFVTRGSSGRRPLHAIMSAILRSKRKSTFRQQSDAPRRSLHDENEIRFRSEQVVTASSVGDPNTTVAAESLLFLQGQLREEVGGNIDPWIATLVVPKTGPNLPEPHGVPGDAWSVLAPQYDSR